MLTFVLSAALQTAAGGNGIPLWGPLLAGMTKEEVRAAQPKATVHLSPECVGVLQFAYEKRKLVSVHLTSVAEERPECAVLVEKTLREKYGPSGFQASRVEQQDCGIGSLGRLCRAMGGEELRTFHSIQWVNRGARIIFERGRGLDWTVDYSVEPQVTKDSLNHL